jgi:hypothetical protein
MVYQLQNRSNQRQAIATHLRRAAEKLRLYRLAANVLQIFARTSRFRDNYYSNGATVSLPIATQDIAELVVYAMHMEPKQSIVLLMGLRKRACCCWSYSRRSWCKGICSSNGIANDRSC